MVGVGKGLRLASMVLLGLTLLFTCIGMGLKSMLVSVDDNNRSGAINVNIGIFRSSVSERTTFANFAHSDTSLYDGDACDMYEDLDILQQERFGDSQSDCRQALVDKCRTSKGFSIIGLMFTVLALATLGVPLVGDILVPWTAPMVFSIVASVSYLITFAVQIPVLNAKPHTSASCGLRLRDLPGDDGFGAAFGLITTCFVFSLIAAILTIVMGRKYGSGLIKSQPTFQNTIVDNPSVMDMSDSVTLDDNEI